MRDRTAGTAGGLTTSSNASHVSRTFVTMRNRKSVRPLRASESPQIPDRSTGMYRLFPAGNPISASAILQPPPPSWTSRRTGWNE